MDLPHQLRRAIEKQLEGKPLSDISAAASGLSESYRSQKAVNKKGHIHSPGDTAAYIAFRMPATYAALYASMNMIRQRMPQFNPASMLDAGAGPGTAMWAATQIWSCIENITLLERDADMIARGKGIAAYSQHNALKSAQYQSTDLAGEWSAQSADLVVCSYVLNELSESTKKKLVERLWNHTTGILVIVEPGTKAGYSNIIKAREQLLSLGVKTVAPCPHDKPCPLDASDWCHFSRRVARTSLHRRAKGGELSYEDEKFSFLCVSKSDPLPVEGVVVRHPQIRKGCIEYKLCTPDGIKTRTVTKRDGESYKHARDMKWGSIL